MAVVFDGLEQFAASLLKMNASELFADTFGRGLAAAVIDEEVHKIIGDAERLPPPLAPDTQTERVDLGFSADETLKRSGDLERSYFWAHTSARITGIGSEDPKAFWHEFGTTRGVPSRHPLSNAFEAVELVSFEAYDGAIGRWLNHVERID